MDGTSWRKNSVDHLMVRILCMVESILLYLLYIHLLKAVNGKPSKVKYGQKNLIIIENFYANPDEVREYALSLPYRKDVHGNHFWRTTPKLDFCGPPEKTIIPTLENHIGRKIIIDKHWQKFNDDEYVMMNMSFYKVINSPDEGHVRANHIHHDQTQWSGIIYLSPTLPANVGTQLWKHKPSGDEFAFGNPDFTGELTDDQYDARGEEPRENWEPTDYVAYKYNRLVLFRGTMFHSASHSDTMPDGDRLNQFFYFNEAL